jgi:glutamate--cysteine ligase catalytic subunit
MKPSMDAMVFGMGCCCLQVTLQCRNVNEARHLYDQLAVLSPLMLALTAASPFFKGRRDSNGFFWGFNGEKKGKLPILMCDGM